MRVIVTCLLVFLLVLTVLWLGSAAVVKGRDAAVRIECLTHLRLIGEGLKNYEDTNSCFPRGTVPNANLPPDRRLSWLVEIWPNYVEGSPKYLFDRTKAWDVADNYSLRWYGKEGDQGLVGQQRLLLCPASPVPSTSELPSLTHYRGIAGVGKDAAELPVSDPRAGFFGYDRKLTRGDIKDGTSTTVAVAEVVDGQPWTAGGQATVQGLDPDGPPYLADGGQFATNHGRHRFPFPTTRSTNVLLVDGSTRTLSSSVSPRVFEALATIAGGEQINDSDY